MSKLIRITSKNFIKMIFILFLSFLTLECMLRVALIFRLGPRVLLYGTPLYKSKEAITETERIKRKTQENIDTKFTAVKVENVMGKYKKYYPKQKIFNINFKGGYCPVRINSSGFRGQDFKEAKPSGILRIVCLGASSTFGFGNKDNETYPYYLEKILNKRLRDFLGREVASVEVINLGIPHLTSEEISHLFIEEALPLNPDIVTYYGGLANAAETRRAQIRRGIPRSFKTNLKRLLTIEFALAIFKDKKKFSKESYLEHRRGKSKLFLQGLSRIKEKCDAQNISFYIIMQQARSLIIDRERLKGISYEAEVELVKNIMKKKSITRRGADFLTHNILMKEMRTWAEQNSVPVIDGIKALDGNRDYLMSYVHLTAEGNYILARAIADKIIFEYNTKQ